MFVVITRNFPPDIGGIQNLMEGLSKGLANHGSVKVFADEYANCNDYDQTSNLDIQRISGFKIFRKFRKAFAANEYLKNNKVKAIFFDHWKSLEHINLEHLNNYTNFCLIHSKEINHPIGSLLNIRMKKNFKKVKFIVANSNYTKNLAIDKGLDGSKIHIINPGTYYPVEIEKEQVKKAKEIFGQNFPKIITIARLDRRKSHQNILMTIKNLLPKFPKLKYISIGDGEERGNLEKLKKELGLDKEVSFVFKSNEQEKLALLEQSDLFVMPSIVHKKSIEGFGITYIEAACYGKASIGGVFGGEADAITEGKTGYLCDGNDLNALYETLLKTLKNENYKLLGSQALEFSKNFSWKKIIKKYIDLI